MEKQSDFFEWYKRKVTDNPQDPPADAWQNIADELDVNDVWDKVAARLDHPGGWFYQKPWNYALPALLLLLLSGGGYLAYDKFAHQAPVATASTYAVADSRAREGQPMDAHTELDSHAAGERKSTTKEPSFGAIDPSDHRTNHLSPDADENSSEEEPETIAGNRTDTGEKSATEETSAIAKSLNNDKLSSDPQKSHGEHTPLAERMPRKRNDTPSGGKELSGRNETSLTKSRDTANINIERFQSEYPPQAMVTTEWDSLASDAIQYLAATDSAASNDDRVTSTHEDGGHIPPSTQRLVYPTFGLGRIVVPDSMLMISPLDATLHYNPQTAEKTTPPSTLTRFSPSLEFGISGAIKNTWLLNQTTFMGLERHTLTTTLPDFGKNIGVAIRYNFASAWSAQAEISFLSGMGQRYHEYRKGRYIERDVDLDYFHGKLLVKYGSNAMVLDRLVNGHGIIGGLFFSKLKSATETIDGHTTDLRDAYTPVDYGVVVGYEYNQRVFNNFFFTSGVRLNYGLKNIRPSTASKTGTGSFDVDFGVRYRFER